MTAPRTPLELLLADEYDATCKQIRATYRYAGLGIGQRAGIRAMWLAISQGERDPEMVAQAGGAALREWSRTWDAEAWELYHVKRMTRFARRLMAAYERRTGVLL